MRTKLNNTTPKSVRELSRIGIDSNISIGVKDSISMDLSNLCLHCGGSGRLRAMQAMAVMGGETIRGPDTTTKCNQCNGTGRL